MGDRDRADGRADVGLGGDGLDSAGIGGAGAGGGGMARAAGFGTDALVMRIEGLPADMRPGGRAAPRMARLRLQEGRR